jgi:hypothetical protein
VCEGYANLQKALIQAQGIPVEQTELDLLKQSIEQQTFYGTLFQKPHEWSDASEYVYLTYTVRIRNNCLVPIDMIELQVVPQSGDILQKADLKVKSLDLKSEGEVQVQILSPKNSHPIREMIVTYYLWGVSGNIKTAYGQ